MCASVIVEACPWKDTREHGGEKLRITLFIVERPQRPDDRCIICPCPVEEAHERGKRRCIAWAEMQRTLITCSSRLRLLRERRRLPEARIGARREDARVVPFAVVFLMQVQPRLICLSRGGKTALLPRPCAVDQGEIRLLWKRVPRRLICRRDLLIRCAHEDERLQEDGVRPILRADGTVAAVPRQTRIMRRLGIVLKRIVAVHQMIFVELFLLPARTSREQQREIAP